MPKRESGLIRMGLVHLAAQRRREPHIKHRSAIIRSRSRTRLTYHAKLGVGSAHAHPRCCRGCT